MQIYTIEIFELIDMYVTLERTNFKMTLKTLIKTYFYFFTYSKKHG